MLFSYFAGVATALLWFRFKEPIKSLWKRTEGEIEKEINKAMK